MSLQIEINEQEVNNLMNINDILYDSITELENKIRKIQKTIDNNKKKIYNTCIHKWEYEIMNSEPCGNRWEKCSKCYLYK